ncbi:MAG: hypothetical protein ABIO70_04255 [Pseudomonadota bacterium]
MATFNRICTAIFDAILGLPPSDAWPWFDLLVWPILGGIVALLVYKYTSNQAGIARAKGRIKMHLVEIRLFNHDLGMVVGATARILLNNALYLGLNVVPMLVMFVPIMAMLVQLEARYAHDPLPVGQDTLLELTLDREHCVLPATAVTLELPPGVVQTAPAVRGPDGTVVWRLRPEQAGDFELTLRIGDEVVTKGLAAGGGPRKVPIMRTKSVEALLYPGEAGLPGGSAVADLRLTYPERVLPWMPDGEMGVLIVFFVVSLVSGYALKDLFGVVL